MPEPSRETVVRWPVPFALAVPALAAAVAITFTPGHTVWFGYILFAGFALLTAAACGAGIAMLPDGIARTGAIAKTTVAALGTLVALVLLLLNVFQPVSGVLPLGEVEPVWAGAVRGLSWTIAGTFALLAVVDLVVGIRQRRADRFARDWIALGVIEAVGAIAIVVVPPTFYQAFSFKEKTGELVSGFVDSSTMIVGIFGAIAAILGVLLVIAGVGLIPERRRREQRERATA